MKSGVDKVAEEEKVEKRLSSKEVKKLAECEETIQRNLSGYYLVGDALLEIQKGELYKAEFTSFDKYCEGRWGFSGSHARRLMEASELVSKLRSKISELGDHELPQNEFQARLFLELRPEKKHWVRSWEVFLKVVRKDKLKITAALIKENVVSKETTKVAPEAKNIPVKVAENAGVKKALTLISEAKAKASEFTTKELTALLVELEELLQAA